MSAPCDLDGIPIDNPDNLYLAFGGNRDTAQEENCND
jgi:hypothetical protein